MNLLLVFTYRVSPKSLVWSDENYYLVAFDEVSGILKNFRVDKMSRVEEADEERSLLAKAHKLNPADYSRKIFGMYGGREELVTIEAKERLAGVILDRFGSDIRLLKSDFGFRVSIRVMISPNFFSWVLSFGKDMKIISPESVRQEFIEILADVKKNYED